MQTLNVISCDANMQPSFLTFGNAIQDIYLNEFRLLGQYCEINPPVLKLEQILGISALNI